MARKWAEALIIILDVGPDSSIVSSNTKETFFERAKQCVIKIMQRKIFQKSIDEVGLILMGAPTNNCLSDNGSSGYEHLHEAINLCIPTWDTIKFIENEVMPQEDRGDLMSGLVLALDILHREQETRKYKGKKIVLLTTFQSRINPNDIESVITSLIKENDETELVVINDNIEQSPDIGHSIGHFSQSTQKTQNQQSSEELITKIVEDTGGVLCHLENAEAQLLFYEKKNVNARPWNCTLQIGSEFKIHIEAFVKITEPKFLDSWKTMSTIGDGEIKRETKYYQNDKEIEVDFDNKISGYMYGSTIVPYDEATLNIGIENNSASLSCLGFSDKKYILPEYLSGKQCHVVFAHSKAEVSQKKFSGLVTAMVQSNLVMIARKVYRKGVCPKINVLFPGFNENGHAFCTMIEMHFSEDMVYIQFPNLNVSKKHKPTEEQLNLMGDLIDSMDLMSAGDPFSGNAEAFALNKTQNPVIQHTCHLIAHRALHPNTPLPQVIEEVKKLIDVPEKIKDASKEILIKAKENFKLEVVKKPSKIEQLEERLKKASITTTTTTGQNGETDENNQPNSQTDSVGTVHPAEDYMQLLRRGEPYGRISNELEQVIDTLVFKAFTIGQIKVIKAIFAYREEAKLLGPSKYNEWIAQFKTQLLSNGMLEFFEQVIVKEGLGYITATESDMSTVQPYEAEEFYKIDISTVQKTIIQEQHDSDDDVMDLLE